MMLASHALVLLGVPLRQVVRQIGAVRRRDTRIAKPSAETVMQQGDVLVLLGAPAALAAAEMRLTQAD